MSAKLQQRWINSVVTVDVSVSGELTARDWELVAEIVAAVEVFVSAVVKERM